jgi:hypothetical protein
MTSRLRILLAVGVAALALLVPAGSAPASIAVKHLAVTPVVPTTGVHNPDQGSTTPLLQAGAHPDLRIQMDFCQAFNPFDGTFRGCTDPELSQHIKDLVVHLPPGLLGNPQVPACPLALWIVFACPADSLVGTSLSDAVTLGGGVVRVPVNLYNVQTLGLEPARLGTGILGASPPGPLALTVKVRSPGDYGVTSTIAGIPKELGGVPATLAAIDTVLFSTNGADPNGKPFFVNPTSCTEKTTAVQVTSYEEPNTLSAPGTSSFTPTGCDQVPFEPNVTVTPDSTQAGAATGYKVAIQYPTKNPNCDPATSDCETYDNDAIWQSALKDADVTLPDGVSLAPGGGVGLEACTADQFGAGTDLPVTCPTASQIGDITVKTPVLGTPLGGKAFFGPATAPGRPTTDKPWKLFLLIEGQGLRIKLVGDVSVDTNGQVRTKFLNQPEVPFSRFELHTFGGDHAPLANPTTCTTHTGDVTLNGYNGKSLAIHPTVTPTGCLDPQPFAPSVDDASAVPSQAGAHSKSHLLISRTDGHQLMNGLKISLPPGAVGSLAAVPLCSYADAKAGTCANESKIGSLRSTVGYGTASLTISGSLYLAQPGVPGDAATIAAVIPSKVGPIDLGNVILLNRVRLRQSDTGVDTISTDGINQDGTPRGVPTMFEGVPLAVQKVEINVDREGFFLNPTGCDVRTTTVTFRSDQGATHSANKAAQATGCDKLPFSPKLRLIAGTKGLTAENAHPPLKALVTQPEGQANIAKARVALPDLIRPNVPQIQKPGALCNDAQLAARACPALSQIGDASVITPVLPFALRGPVYIVLKAGSPLPNLAVFLRGGGFEVLLTAGNGFQGIRILNTFDSVPDVAQSRFRLSVKGGPDGILLNHADLCKTTPLPTFDSTFTGQNGKVVSAKPQLEVRGCASVGAKGGLSIVSRVVKVTTKHVAPIKLRCAPGGGTCKGKLSLAKLGGKKFSIKAGKTKVVKVKLTRKGFRAVRKAKQKRLRAVATLSGKKRATKKLTLKAPSKKH